MKEVRLKHTKHSPDYKKVVVELKDGRSFVGFLWSKNENDIEMAFARELHGRECHGPLIPSVFFKKSKILALDGKRIKV